MSLPEHINFGLSIAITFFLVPVILTKSPKPMGNYKYFLLSFILCDLHYSIVHFVIQPVVGPYKDAFLMYGTGWWNSHVAVCYFSTSHSQALLLLTYHFVYRYTVTHRPRFLDRIGSGGVFTILLAIAVIEAAFWFWAVYYLYGSDRELQEYVHDMVEEAHPGHTPLVIGTLYWNERGEINWRGLAGFGALELVMVIATGTIVFCSVKIVPVLFGRHVLRSSKTIRMQRQLFVTLVLQLIIPLLLIYLPVLVNVAAPLLRINLAFDIGFESIFLTAFPFVDALVILFGVSEYRNFLLTVTRMKKPVGRIMQAIQRPSNTSRVAPSAAVTNNTSNNARASNSLVLA